MASENNFRESKWDLLLKQNVQPEGLREGTTRAVHAAIETLEPLARQIIGYWCKKFPYYSQEIESEGLYALTKAVTSRPSHPNLVGYCRGSIDGRIRNIIKDTAQVRVPRSVQDRLRSEGTYQPPELKSLDVDENEDKPDMFYSASSFGDNVGPEYLKFCCEQLILTKFERQVLDSIIAGHDCSRMSRTTRMSRTACRNTRNDLLVRLNKVATNPEFKKVFYGN